MWTLYDPTNDSFIRIDTKELIDELVTSMEWEDTATSYSTDWLFTALASMNRGQRKALEGVRVICNHDYTDFTEIGEWYMHRLDFLNERRKK